MTKAEVIAEIVNKTGIDKANVSETVETFFKVVRTSMTDGRNLYFRGFGSFIVKKRAKKIARNISRNTAIEIPEHFIPAFKPAKSFADKVKKNAKPAAKPSRKKK